MNPLRLPATPRILTAAGGQRLRSVHSAGPSADSRDRTVQQTDQDASQSRLSAVETGYLHDDFASAFCQQKGIRKFPLINRGEGAPSPPDSSAPLWLTGLCRGAAGAIA